MNFEAAIVTINKNFFNLYLAKYLKAQWGVVAGFNTVPEYIAVMKKTLADWQLENCNNDWCSKVSTDADITVLSTCSFAPAGACVLNPPLFPCHPPHRWQRMNVNEILIGSFTR